MSAGPRVTIVLANWNGGRYLDEALASVVAQRYADWRLVCVDTASTDRSRQILENWAARDPRIEVICLPERLNYPAAINAGIRRAETEYIARIESDDVWHPAKLARQLGFLDANQGVGVCGTDVALIDDLGRLRGVKRFPRAHGECLRAIWYRNPFCHSSVVLRRRVLETCGSYDEQSYLVEDLDLWFRAGRRWQLRNLAEVLVGYRIWWGTLTQTRMRVIVWRSYRQRVDRAVSYGYHCPWTARAYGVATLAAALLPARMVIALFNFVLKVFSRRGPSPAAEAGGFWADASSTCLPLPQASNETEAVPTTSAHKPTSELGPAGGRLDPIPVKYALAPDQASPQFRVVMR
jgi:glycosyltransferase involved in cell wall biosynthesis